MSVGGRKVREAVVQGQQLCGPEGAEGQHLAGAGLSGALLHPCDGELFLLLPENKTVASLVFVLQSKPRLESGCSSLGGGRFGELTSTTRLGRKT